MIFETHAHYDDEKFDEDRAELLSSMQENGIGRIINVSANLESLENTRKLMEAYPFIYGAFGLHPDEVGDLNEDVMARMRELCRMEKAVAVGEIGLDYYWDKENHEKQEYWFRRQIALACSKSGWSEGAALTLGGQRPRRQKTYDFDDL